MDWEQIILKLLLHFKYTGIFPAISPVQTHLKLFSRNLKLNLANACHRHQDSSNPTSLRGRSLRNGCHERIRFAKDLVGAIVVKEKGKRMGKGGVCFQTMIQVETLKKESWKEGELSRKPKIQHSLVLRNLQPGWWGLLEHKSPNIGVPYPKELAGPHAPQCSVIGWWKHKQHRGPRKAAAGLPVHLLSLQVNVKARTLERPGCSQSTLISTQSKICLLR